MIAKDVQRVWLNTMVPYRSVRAIEEVSVWDTNTYASKRLVESLVQSAVILDLRKAVEGGLFPRADEITATYAD